MIKFKMNGFESLNHYFGAVLKGKCQEQKIELCKELKDPDIMIAFKIAVQVQTTNNPIGPENCFCSELGLVKVKYWYCDIH